MRADILTIQLSSPSHRESFYVTGTSFISDGTGVSLDVTDGSRVKGRYAAGNENSLCDGAAVTAGTINRSNDHKKVLVSTVNSCDVTCGSRCDKKEWSTSCHPSPVTLGHLLLGIACQW